MNYTQLTQEERYQIYAFKQAGFSQTAIARELGVHKSTICRELQRNQGLRGYRPRQAQLLAQERQRQRARQTRIKPLTWARVESLLCQQWSPEQVAGRLEAEGLTISHERIYQYVYADKRAGGTLYQHLRCRKQRRKRYGSGRRRRGQIADRVCISERPAIVAERSRLGDWEVDTIVGKGHQQAVVSLLERRSRYTLLHKVESATAFNVQDAIVRQLKPLSDKVATITSDNGKEFAGHQVIAQVLQADFYFAHPYASWERGSNENCNGLVRQYLPKGSDFTEVTQDHAAAIAERLNHRPRKVLGYRTPHEVFYGTEPVALST